MVEIAKHSCEICRETKRATHESPYHFTDSGLPNVYLTGIRYFVCAKCNKQAAEIPAVKELMKAIARAVVGKETSLSGPEIRFLRKRLGKKATEFAQIIGVVPEQVSRWENAANPPEKSADKLIRLYYSLESGDKALEKKLHADMARLATVRAEPEHLQRIEAAIGRKQEWMAEPVAV